ncbi:MAG: tetratricopeptide repeat protein [Anaerolineales bacterium]
MAEGEFALVREHLGAALNKPSQGWAPVGDHELYSMLADAAAQQRDEATLRQYAPLAEETARRYGHTLYQAIAHRAWGVAHRLAGEYPQAEARLNQALDLFSSLNTRWQIGRTLLELGELAVARKNIVKAQGHFTRALAAFEVMRATSDAARTRTRLEQI